MKTKLNSSPYLIGITGSIGTGKSLVGDILSEYGALVIDTDNIVRDILSTKNQISQTIVNEFDGSILLQSSKEYIDRKALAVLVFSDALKRKKLELIIHPEVQRQVEQTVLSNTEKSIIAVLIPLLFECSLEHFYDETWCVICDDAIQLKRLLDKGYATHDAKARISAQFSQEEKAKRADFIINNSGSLLKTKEQVLARLKSLDLNYRLD